LSTSTTSLQWQRPGFCNIRTRRAAAGALPAGALPGGRAGRGRPARARRRGVPRRRRAGSALLGDSERGAHGPGQPDDARPPRPGRLAGRGAGCAGPGAQEAARPRLFPPPRLVLTAVLHKSGRCH
jgi:hypothetical protein